MKCINRKTLVMMIICFVLLSCLTRKDGKEIPSPFYNNPKNHEDYPILTFDDIDFKSREHASKLDLNLILEHVNIVSSCNGDDPLIVVNSKISLINSSNNKLFVRSPLGLRFVDSVSNLVVSITYLNGETINFYEIPFDHYVDRHPLLEPAEEDFILLGSGEKLSYFNEIVIPKSYTESGQLITIKPGKYIFSIYYWNYQVGFNISSLDLVNNSNYENLENRGQNSRMNIYEDQENELLVDLNSWIGRVDSNVEFISVPNLHCKNWK